MLDRRDAIQVYFDQMKREGFSKHSMSIYLKPLFNLYHGTINAKRWRQHLQNIIKTKKIETLLEGW